MTMRSLKSPTHENIEMADYLPEFSVDEKKLPEAKNWKIGKKYKMEVEVEMVGSHKEEYSKEKEIKHRFKITKIGVDDDEKMVARRGNGY